MRQVETINNCLLNLGPNVDFATVEKISTYAPGGKCINCSVRPGIPGRDGYGIIYLPLGMRLDRNRNIIADPGISQESCKFGCRIPDNVEVILDEATTPC